MVSVVNTSVHKLTLRGNLYSVAIVLDRLDLPCLSTLIVDGKGPAPTGDLLGVCHSPFNSLSLLTFAAGVDSPRHLHHLLARMPNVHTATIRDFESFELFASRGDPDTIPIDLIDFDLGFPYNNDGPDPLEGLIIECPKMVNLACIMDKGPSAGHHIWGVLCFFLNRRRAAGCTALKTLTIPETGWRSPLLNRALNFQPALELIEVCLPSTLHLVKSLTIESDQTEECANLKPQWYNPSPSCRPLYFMPVASPPHV